MSKDKIHNARRERAEATCEAWNNALDTIKTDPGMSSAGALRQQMIRDGWRLLAFAYRMDGETVIKDEGSLGEMEHLVKHLEARMAEINNGGEGNE